jgi:transposase
VRSRIDWKYGLNLERTDPGFDHTVLGEFRARLIAGSAAHLLDTLLQVCRARKLLKARGRQRTDSTHVLATIRVLNRLECVGETLAMHSTVWWSWPRRVSGGVGRALWEAGRGLSPAP